VLAGYVNAHQANVVEARETCQGERDTSSKRLRTWMCSLDGTPLNLLPEGLWDDNDRDFAFSADNRHADLSEYRR
jgi:hypothetical protein